MTASKQELIRFPCRFPVKAMGLNSPDFAAHVESLISTHLEGNTHPLELHWQASKAERFISVTATLMATSRAQLDAIYQTLSDDERVIMAL